MNKSFNFYSVIIGTELLNGRRKDAHFSYLNEQLLKRGWEHKASFVIDDDPLFMENIFKLIKSDEDSVMFCFGGIGATPDDFTREVAAKAFRDGEMEFHQKAKELIEKQFGNEAYPHRINMSYLPINAKLLKNVVNNVAGFYLDDRFFFTPGFPSMSQYMVVEALDKCYPRCSETKYRETFMVHTGENEVIDFMKKVPKSIDCSSLPRLTKNGRKTALSLASYNKEVLDEYIQKAKEYLNSKNIEFDVGDFE